MLARFLGPLEEFPCRDERASQTVMAGDAVTNKGAGQTRRSE